MRPLMVAAFAALLLSSCAGFSEKTSPCVCVWEKIGTDTEYVG